MASAYLLKLLKYIAKQYDVNFGLHHVLWITSGETNTKGPLALSS